VAAQVAVVPGVLMGRRARSGAAHTVWAASAATPDAGHEVAPRDSGEPESDEALHDLLLQLAGHLPAAVLTGARDRLAAGERREVARRVAFAAMAQPVPLTPDEAAVLRAELTAGPATGDAGGPDRDLAAALDEALDAARGDREPAPWLFQSTRTGSGADPAAARPLDLTVADVDELDAADRALVALARDTPGVRALWRAWRMPAGSHAWHAPVRVVVLAVAPGAGRLPAVEAATRAALRAAGDPHGQAEVYRSGRADLYFQTLARCCGALLWAARPPQPVAVAPVFDGADDTRGPWFAAGHPAVPDRAERAWLLQALRAAPVIVWTSTAMTDVLDPRAGAVVPRHLRSDGRWVWSEAVAFYLEQHGLAPDPRLTAHLHRPDAGPPEETALHRAMVHVFDRGPDSTAWFAPPA